MNFFRIFVEGFIEFIQLDQRIQNISLQVLIGKTNANVRGQCVDGVEFENIVGVVNSPIAQLPRKRRHHNRNNLSRIGINYEPLNLQFWLFQMIVKNLGIFTGTMFEFLHELRQIMRRVSIEKLGSRSRISKYLSRTLPFTILIVSANISLLSIWSLIRMSPQKLGTMPVSMPALSLMSRGAIKSPKSKQLDMSLRSY
jgi:hypothetical protein